MLALMLGLMDDPFGLIAYSHYLNERSMNETNTSDTQVRHAVRYVTPSGNVGYVGPFTIEGAETFAAHRKECGCPTVEIVQLHKPWQESAQTAPTEPPKSNRQIKREETRRNERSHLWREVYVATIRAGGLPSGARACANAAVEDFERAFPPV